MKRIRANRSIKSGAGTRRGDEMTRSDSATHLAEGFSQYRVNVEADGREHFAVPLTGPKHKPGTPYLIAHFSLPPPKERQVLLDELARILARAAVDRLLNEN
jgi:hypothetical protein